MKKGNRFEFHSFDHYGCDADPVGIVRRRLDVGRYAALAQDGRRALGPWALWTDVGGHDVPSVVDQTTAGQLMGNHQGDAAGRPRSLLQCRSLIWLVFASALLVTAAGCRPQGADTSGIEMALTLEPSPPVVGDANVALNVTDAKGEPVQGAEVKIEGNMNHAGMKPSFADLNETEPGNYAGTLEFTMGGDWFILVTATTAEGERVERKIDVPGVKSP